MWYCFVTRFTSDSIFQATEAANIQVFIRKVHSLNPRKRCLTKSHFCYLARCEELIGWITAYLGKS